MSYRLGINAQQLFTKPLSFDRSVDGLGVVHHFYISNVLAICNIVIYLIVRLRKRQEKNAL